jgi:hypothetical protein
LAKRSPDDAPAPGELEKLTAREMIEAIAKGVGKTRDVPDRGIEVEHVHREIANVTVRPAVYVEYLHTWCVRARGGRSSTPSGSTLEPRDGHAISVRHAASASRGSLDDPGEHGLQVGAGEGPVEWSGDLAVVLAEAQQPIGELITRVAMADDSKEPDSPSHPFDTNDAQGGDTAICPVRRPSDKP